MGLYDTSPQPQGTPAVVTPDAPLQFQLVSNMDLRDGDPVLHCGHTDSTDPWNASTANSTRTLKNGYLVNPLFNAACKTCVDASIAETPTPVKLTSFSSWDGTANKPSASGSLPLR